MFAWQPRQITKSLRRTSPSLTHVWSRHTGHFTSIGWRSKSGMFITLIENENEIIGRLPLMAKVPECNGLPKPASRLSSLPLPNTGFRDLTTCAQFPYFSRQTIEQLHVRLTDLEIG